MYCKLLETNPTISPSFDTQSMYKAHHLHLQNLADSLMQSDLQHVRFLHNDATMSNHRVVLALLCNYLCQYVFVLINNTV